MKFLTGSEIVNAAANAAAFTIKSASAVLAALNRCDSGTDGTVRMREDPGGEAVRRRFLTHTPGRIFAPGVFVCEKGLCKYFRKGHDTMEQAGQVKKVNVRALAVTAVLGAVASALMFVGIHVPLMPSFLQLDFSELPALIASFSLGPLSGAAVCLIKNLVHLLATSTGGVGELSNFLLGAAFVLPAGIIYKVKKDRLGALIGALTGAAAMALLSFPSNLFIVYPAYGLVMPMEAILDMYRAINPNVKTLSDALIWFNMPFTFVKGLLSTAVTFLIYKRISPILKGTK